MAVEGFWRNVGLQTSLSRQSVLPQPRISPFDRSDINTNTQTPLDAVPTQQRKPICSSEYSLSWSCSDTTHAQKRTNIPHKYTHAYSADSLDWIWVRPTHGTETQTHTNWMFSRVLSVIIKCFLLSVLSQIQPLAGRSVQASHTHKHTLMRWPSACQPVFLSVWQWWSANDGGQSNNSLADQTLSHPA